MKIVMTGGGSGGHITPLLAVASELKKLERSIDVVYIGQRGDTLGSRVKENDCFDETYYVSAGKFRRYHGEGFRQLLDVRTLFLNIRDAFRTLIGILQSYRLLGKVQPDAIFVKGGFVGVPVGLAAALRKIPFITHDSDALPGLANRIIARWARLHAVALPKEVYAYDPKKTITVGVPINESYKPVTAHAIAAARTAIGIPDAEQVVLLTGGGNGAQALNEAMIESAGPLLSRSKKLYIILLVGHKHQKTVEQALKTLPEEQRLRVIVKDFVPNMYDYSAAATVIVTRAGATSLAEFAAQHKACIIVPNPLLTGGHQLKNAEVLTKEQAAVVVHSDRILYDWKVLLTEIEKLLQSPDTVKKLGENLGKFAKYDAAEQLAVLLINVAGAK